MSESPFTPIHRKHDTDRILKIAILGDGFCGKTAITDRFCIGQFKQAYKMTIGVNFGTKKARYKTGETITLQLWDIAGQERFKAFRTQYYKGAYGAILVYDITNKLTFHDCPNWVTEYQQKVGENGNRVVVMGNKVDLAGSPKVDPRTKKPYERQVTAEEGKNFADSIRSPFFETSAKDNLNIDESFAMLVDLILAKKKSKTLVLDSFATIEAGFKSLEMVFAENNVGKIYDALIKLKQSIFFSNPYSCVLGNMSEFIAYLPNAELTGEVKTSLSQASEAWKKYYTVSLKDGQYVTSEIKE